MGGLNMDNSSYMAMFQEIRMSSLTTWIGEWWGGLNMDNSSYIGKGVGSLYFIPCNWNHYCISAHQQYSVKSIFEIHKVTKDSPL